MKSYKGSFGLRKLALGMSCFILMTAVFALPPVGAYAQDEEPEFTRDFRLEDCRFKAKGENPYFILKPGYQLILEGEEEGELKRVEITVLDEKETINVPEIGKVRTRVVEEVETTDGELTEISRNFYAICAQTNDVYYFGEDVDIYNEDGTITHEGAWRSGEPDEDGVAEPGIIMPGTFLLGSRYYQELAEGIALDRAEHTEMGLEVTVRAGTFTDCVQVIETTPLEPGAESEKIYCPKIGLVQDGVIGLVEYGFVDPDDDDDSE
jgi:hypothetical protein